VGRNASRYYARFSALELQQTFFNPPRRATLQRLRDLAPAGFGFIVKAWQLITHEADAPGYRRLGSPLPAPAGDYGHLQRTQAVLEALQATQEAAATLEASALLFETPASFAPTAQHRARLAAFFEAVDRQGRDLVWDPRGVWSEPEIMRICADLHLIPCRDPYSLEGPCAPEAYLKVQGMGRAQRLGDDELLELLEVLQPTRRAYCLFNTVEMQRDATRLLSLLGEVAEDDDEEQDDEEQDESGEGLED